MDPEEDRGAPLSMVRKLLYVFGERGERQEKIPAGRFYSVSSGSILFAVVPREGVEPS